jgi:hypothetical protein
LILLANRGMVYFFNLHWRDHMRFKEIDLEDLPTFTQDADLYRPANGNTRLWGWGDGTWCLLRSGDEKALYWEDDYDVDCADDEVDLPDDPELWKAHNARIEALKDDAAVSAARQWADEREAVGRLGGSESDQERQQGPDISHLISERYKPLQPAVVPRVTGQAWHEIVDSAVHASEDEEIDVDQIVIDLLALGFPEQLVDLFDWTRGMRAAG